MLPDIGEDPPTILDIEDAPPITREAIMQLVVLGVYPLTSEMLALPNVLLDAATAAFMIVNAFAPRAAAQYPVPAEAAFGVLTVLTGTDLQPADLVDVGTFRGLIITVVEVEAGLGAEVAASLDEQYPALIAGNPGAPLTRAGAALMTAIGLDALSRQAD
ncbi:MAG: hypothetical protein H0X64_03610 [Gemmatimonadaceae bacterium]|nr:hypothetical protein [Gemmatimonadaceae bacterium]